MADFLMEFENFFGIVEAVASRKFNNNGESRKHFVAFAIRKENVDSRLFHNSLTIKATNFIKPQIVLNGNEAPVYKIPKQFFELKNSIRKLVIFHNVCPTRSPPTKPQKYGIIRIASFY